MYKRFLSNSSLYFAASLGARGLSFVLTPLYTRVLSPEDYGVLGLANTVTALASLLLGLGLHASISRLWFEVEHDKLVSTLAWALLLPVVGLLLPDPLRLLPSEFFRLTLLAGWLSVFHALPQAVFQTKEEPRQVAVFNLSLVVVQLCSILTLVHQGIVGVLRANVISSAIMACVSLWMVRAYLKAWVDTALLRRALVFSLPLVPHLLSNWALSLSDRVLLERWVSAAALGAYTLAYLFNGVCVMACSSLMQALSPMVTRGLKDKSHGVERLGLVAWAAMCGFCLLVALAAPWLLSVLAPRGPLDEALRYVPWVVLGAALQGGYFIVSQGTWFSMRTGWVGPITLAAATCNVLLNVWLIPELGVWAAAVNTAVGYGLLLLFHARLAHALHPIAWPYGRALAIAALCLGVYGVLA